MITILENKKTLKTGIADHKGLIESRNGEQLSVLVYDLDGGLAGPYQLTVDDIDPGWRGLCAECGQPFTEAEWEARHSVGEEDFHEGCCPECRGEENG